jgi:hypothetical protein
VTVGMHVCGSCIPCAHPVGVALESVDFAVVTQHPHGLRTTPRGKCVGGETRVHKREVRLE